MFPHKIDHAKMKLLTLFVSRAETETWFKLTSGLDDGGKWKKCDS